MGNNFKYIKRFLYESSVPPKLRKEKIFTKYIKEHIYIYTWGMLLRIIIKLIQSNYKY